MTMSTSCIRAAAGGLMFLLAAGAVPAAGKMTKKVDFGFVNVADTTNGEFTRFGPMPAINSVGAVAFNATGTDFTSGAVFKSDDGVLTTIASSADGVLTSFGDSVVINSEGVVGFSFRFTVGGDAILATGDGGPMNTIADANQQGLVGGPFLGIGGMNDSGTVVFLAIRTGFASQAIFAGDGGPLTALIDTATNPDFTSLGNAAINASGKIVFRASLADGSEGIFTGEGGSRDVADTNNPDFGGFLDPVINKHGTVASAAFLNLGGMEVFTSNHKGITARTNPASPLFTFVDNVSVNDFGDVAFFADESTGDEGIFLEATGGDSPVPVIEVGDPLFGSTATQVNLGRCSLNDRDRISFLYVLADGREGIAIASLQHGKDN